QSIKIKEREKIQKPKTDPATGKWYTNISILNVDPVLVKECKKYLRDLQQNSVYSKKSNIKYIPKEIQKAWFRETANEYPEFLNTAKDWNINNDNISNQQELDNESEQETDNTLK
ncbi:22376_t:CDS:2, partial [Gigaspora rosea]